MWHRCGLSLIVIFETWRVWKYILAHNMLYSNILFVITREVHKVQARKSKKTLLPGTENLQATVLEKMAVLEVHRVCFRQFFLASRILVFFLLCHALLAYQEMLIGCLKQSKSLISAVHCQGNNRVQRLFKKTLPPLFFQNFRMINKKSFWYGLKPLHCNGFFLCRCALEPQELSCTKLVLQFS